MQSKVEICGVNTAHLPVLKNEETERLLLRSRDGDKAAREQLIAGNLRLVLSVIQRFTRRGENVDDLFQVGCIGLIKAIDNFDPKHEVRFSTYGVPTVIEWRRRERDLPMTRKQAISVAIQALAETGENEEAIKILHSISDELPLNRWTEDAIRDSVEQFILDHGRAPTCTDFKKKCLPPHTVIKLRFGLTLQEWLDKNYPAEKPSIDEKRTKATENFVKEYLSIQPFSAEDYNARRSPASLSWFTIATYNHTRRWRVLLEKLELPAFSSRDVPKDKTAFKVNIISDYDFKD